MTANEWDEADYAALRFLAEEDGATILSEAQLHRDVAQALALVKDEPAPTIAYHVNRGAAAAFFASQRGGQPIAAWKPEPPEPDDEPDETLPAWGALFWSGVRLAGKTVVAVVLIGVVAWFVGSR